MTLNKSLISISAAALLVAGMTGCSSSSSSSSNPTAGTVTSVSAIDGYIYNAKATAFTMNDKNETDTLNLKTTKVGKTIADGTLVKGKFTYDVLDTNTSAAKDIRYITLAYQAKTTDADNNYYPTFIDANNDGDYNVTQGDIAVAPTWTLRAPNGFAIASPISELVYQNSESVLKANGELNTTAVKDATLKIADALGLTPAKITTEDPINTSDAKYAAVNAFVAGSNDLKILAAALAKQPKAKDFSAALENITVADPTNTVAKNFKVAYDNGDVTDETLSSVNFDKTRENDGAPVANEPAKGAIADINNTTINSASNIVANGDKVKDSDLDIFDIHFAKKDTDTNASAEIGLMLRIANDINTTSGTKSGNEIVVKITGLDLKKVGKNPASLDQNDSKVKLSYAYRYVTNGETTAESANDVDVTALGLGGTGIVESASGKATIKIADIFDKVDDNSSKPGAIDALTVAISEVEVGIIDADGKVNFVDSKGNTELKSPKSITDAGLNLSANTKSLLSVTKYGLDLRTPINGITRKNSAPDYNASVTSIMEDVDTASADTNVTISIAKLDSDNMEKLTKFEFSTLAAPALAISKAGDVNGTSSLNLQMTLDTNSSGNAYDTGSHPTYVFTYKPTDEFGAIGTERNVTIKLNRALAAQTKAFGKDFNNTERLLTVGSFFTDPDGDKFVDANYSIGATITETNARSTEANVTADGNLTIGTLDVAGTYYIHIKVKDENNLNSGTQNITFEVK